MGTLTKIMVILTFLASLVVALVALKMADRIVKQDAIIESLTTTGEAQKEMAASWATVLNSAQDKVSQIQSEEESIRNELKAAQDSLQRTEQSLTDAQSAQEAAIQELSELKDKNDKLTQAVASEKAKAAQAIKAAKASGSGAKQPIGRVTTVTPQSGITTYFTGTATVKDGDSLSVYRQKKKIGDVNVGSVKQTIVIYSQGEGSTASPMKGDLVRK